MSARRLGIVGGGHLGRVLAIPNPPFADIGTRESFDAPIVASG